MNQELKAKETQEICLPLTVLQDLNPTDLSVLGAVMQEDSISISEVAKEHNLDKGNVSKSSKKLEELGLLNRKKESGKYGKTTLELTL